MGDIRTYKDLRVWKLAVQIAVNIYKLTDNISHDEKFGIVSQLKRSSISIASNIAEGWGRETTKSFINYLRIARGSLYELETQLIICENVELIKKIELIQLFKDIELEGKMINSLIKSLQSKVKEYLKEDSSVYEVKIETTNR